MPQLMPLMWMGSVMMSLLIFIMLIIMYSYMDLKIVEISKNLDLLKIMYKW